MRKVVSLFILICFCATGQFNVALAVPSESSFRLPKPGVMVHLSPVFNPPVLKGIKVYPDKPFRFDFILDQGDKQLSKKGLEAESSKLIKYFLASLTVPEKDLWVNLSPYEKDRTIPDSFGLTQMGRDLLAQDYILKQITASLIYPEGEIGKKFWKRIYGQVSEKFGKTTMPVNTFNKVWIVPRKAVVYESSKIKTAYIIESKFDVLLEEDYLSSQKHHQEESGSALAKNMLKEFIIPELEREVNENKNFSQLRQIYNSLILAAWYKQKIKNSLLNQVYADKNKIEGIHIEDPHEKDRIYQKYLMAFKKGVYNYIREDADQLTNQAIARKYFSGGVNCTALKVDFVASKSISIEKVDAAKDENMAMITAEAGVVQMDLKRHRIDSAMIGGYTRKTINEIINARIINHKWLASQLNQLRVDTGKQFYKALLQIVKARSTKDEVRSVVLNMLFDILTSANNPAVFNAIAMDFLISSGIYPLQARKIVLEMAAVSKTADRQQRIQFLRNLNGRTYMAGYFLIHLLRKDKPFLEAVSQDQTINLHLRLYAKGILYDEHDEILVKDSDFEEEAKSFLMEFSESGSVENKILNSPFGVIEIKVINLAILIQMRKILFGTGFVESFGHMAKLVMQSRVRQNYYNANAGHEYGYPYIKRRGAKYFLMIVAHELTHNALFLLGYPVDAGIHYASIHEYIADLISLLFASQMNFLSEEYERRLSPYLSQHWDIVDEEHDAARLYIARIYFYLKAMSFDHRRGVLRKIAGQAVSAILGDTWERSDLHRLVRASLEGTTSIDPFFELREPSKRKNPATSGGSDSLMGTGRRAGNNGGIDFTYNRMPLMVQDDGREIKFTLDPQQLAQLQSISGFTPVIINIQPTVHLKEFLGV